jgi:hypothetical protein
MPIVPDPMRGFRRLPGAEHIVHAVELPELTRRRRPVGADGAFVGRAGASHTGPGQRPTFRAAEGPDARGTLDGRPKFPRRGSNGNGNGNGDGHTYEVPRPEVHRPEVHRPEPPRLDHAPRMEPVERLAAVDVPRPAARNDEDGRVALLERRLAKLSKLLEERTQQLQLRMDAQATEPGMASRYGEVQGLRGDSEETQRKRELMSAIFEANRKLRERVGSAGPDAE